MHVFGLTGGMASGKSTVARVFASLGVPVLDADLVAREVVKPGTSALTELTAHFGDCILHADGTLNRKELGARVFGNADAVAFLNATTHPRIAEITAKKLAEFATSGTELACYDAALMFEKGLDANFKPVVLVVAPEHVRIARIVARDSLSEAEARARIAVQLPDSEKQIRAQYTRNNNATLADVETQAAQVLTLVRAGFGLAPRS